MRRQITVMAVIGLTAWPVFSGHNDPALDGVASRSRRAPVVDARAAARGPRTGAGWTEPDSGMEFVWIPAIACWIGKYEVTNAEFRKFKPGHNSGHYQQFSLTGDRLPVVQFAFADVLAFAEWLTTKERKAGRLDGKLKYRLPTDEEWERFARCGDNRPYPWGTEWPPKYGNYPDAKAGQSFADWRAIGEYDDGFASTCPVERSGKNDWGLYGVGGNVWDLTLEPGATEPHMRGGSCDYGSVTDLLCSHSCRYVPTLCNYFVGFRLIIAP